LSALKIPLEKPGNLSMDGARKTLIDERMRREREAGRMERRSEA
jgi:hypothetical protein